MATRRRRGRRKKQIMHLWSWIIFGALAGLVALQEFRIYQMLATFRKREELFQIVTENAADMIALVDVKGRRLYNSPAYKRLLGYSPAELGETSAFEQIHPDDRFNVLEAAREARETGIGRRLEYRIKHKNGSWRVLESLASAIRDKHSGEVARLVISNRDITERKRAEEQLEHNSFHDSLTGLPNRRLFLDRLQHAFARVQRYPDSPYAVLFVDIDDFRTFNHHRGAAAGDVVIQETGRRLNTGLRNEDTVSRPQGKSPPTEIVLSRLGGDEFTILLDGIENASDAMRVAQRIQGTLAEPFLVDGEKQRISASIGIALSTPAHKKAEDLLQDADVAMRRAKALGGGHCEVFDEAMHTHAVKRLQLEAELQVALEKRQFRVYYQPVVQLESQRIVGFETLLRWHHPEQGVISPHKFLDAAEDIGLLLGISHWLLLQACEQLRQWQKLAPAAETYMSVNISARQLASPLLVSDIQAALRQAGIEPLRLRVELTEKVAALDPKLTMSVLTQLKQLGVGRILDNFGSGNFSLNGLRQVPVDALKIDRSLVGEMLSDRTASDIVEVIVALAHKMNLKTIAEGVETGKQLEHLRGLRCEFGQGFVFSQPVEAEAAEKLLLAEPAARNGVAAGK